MKLTKQRLDSIVKEEVASTRLNDWRRWKLGDKVAWNPSRSDEIR